MDNPQSPPDRLGVIVSGSLTKGLEVRLDASCSVEDMAVGRYVTIEGQRQRFFGMVTDVILNSTNQQLAATPPDMSDPFVAKVLRRTATYGSLHVLPMLSISRSQLAPVDGPAPVKTVPSHFSDVREASEADMALVFGADDDRHFHIGTPLDMETKICLNLGRLIERSNGVFGKTGTGKTFLARLLLIGMIQKSEAATLTFDMHSDYGWEGQAENGHGSVKGLKNLFPSRVAVFTLDEESSRRRRVPVDYTVQIGYDQIEPQDIELLSETLTLSSRAMDAIDLLRKRFGRRDWLRSFLAIEDVEDRDNLAEELGIHVGTLRALNMSLGRLRRFRFLVPRADGSSVEQILNYLQRGMHVVLEFGRYTDFAAYILVANILTRRIHELYVERVERALGESGQKPRPLVIVIEEAHKFLNPEVARQTIFGTIAREMRKYNVTLLVVDQRPSGIDEEVMSQLGTRISCLLDNEKDVDAVLTGVSGRNELRSVLAKLESRQQALILGHAVPMPVVIRTREYGSVDSYAALSALAGARGRSAKEELWG
jgi:DNA helicase HerA-like ATPase